MKAVDVKMETCCLKHEIRCALWETYARKVVGPRGTLRRYLTLFSPAMMDIKHFHRQGLIAFAEGQYKGVVGITNDEEAYADTIGSGAGRPELLIRADLNDLMARPSLYPNYDDELRKMFPFEVINLDYCNSMFFKGDQGQVSQHIRALDTIIRRQRKTGCERFAIFVTTLAQRRQVGAPFLSDLVGRIDRNLSDNQGFADRFRRLFRSRSGSELRDKNHRAFMPLGLAKFVADLISVAGYEVGDCDTAYLFRRSGHWVLHAAILAEFPADADLPLRSLGRQVHLERKLTRYLDRSIKGQLLHLSEAQDAPRLERKYRAYVAELAATNFELPVPEPKQL